jgi:hypothetical protein
MHYGNIGNVCLAVCLAMTACSSPKQKPSAVTSDKTPAITDTTAAEAGDKEAEHDTITVNDREEEQMLSEHSVGTVPLEKALILRTTERMGMVSHSLRTDISESLRRGVTEGVRISSGRYLEDYEDADEILLFFPAAPINGLAGQFILTLSVQSRSPDTPGYMAIQRAWMVQRNMQVAVHVALQADAPVNERWAYTRHPHLRVVHVAMFDDPDTVQEIQVFHQVPFSAEPEHARQIPGDADWTTVEFKPAPRFIEQSMAIDACESLLEVLNDRFAVKTGDFLQWSRQSVTVEGIDDLASEVENRLFEQGQPARAFNVTVEVDSHELVRNKRVLPLVKHAVTLIQEDGAIRAGTIGCSLSR